MRLDHGGQYIFHYQWFFALCYGLSGDIICSSENSTKIIRWMAPFCSQPGVVEVQPADHSADIEGCLYRIQLKLGARNFCAVWDYGPRHNRPQELCTCRIP